MKKIFEYPRLLKKMTAILFDCICCLISSYFAFLITLSNWKMFSGTEWLVPIISISISLPLFVSFGLYRAIFRYVGSMVLFFILKAFLVYGSIFIFIFTIYGVNNIPKSIGIIQPVLLFLLVCNVRFVIRDLLFDIFPNHNLFIKKSNNAFIYGAGLPGRQLLNILSNTREVTVLGFIDDSPDLIGSTINGVPIYSSSNLERLIRFNNVKNIFLALSNNTQTIRNNIINRLYGCNVRVRSLPNLNDFAVGKLTLSDLDINNLLGREIIPPNIDLMKKNITGKSILITGAGGSIGSELCRQIIKFSPKTLILVDNNEYSLYQIFEELKKLISSENSINKIISNDITQLSTFINPSIHIEASLSCARDEKLMSDIFFKFKPNTVFHAAAYKHVPLVELNPFEGLRNNIHSTLICSKLSLKYSVENFILISTDKAVRPTNIMGASKRISELILQALNHFSNNKKSITKLSIVRFGNVLGSSGSVAPLFIEQIKSGGPISLTHIDVTRYFMTIPEAAQLVIQASAMASGGDVFVLDMGKPVRIYDLALRMIHFSGLLLKDDLNPNGDIEIKITGLRPGEKLHEELLIGNDPKTTEHQKIMKAHEHFIPFDLLEIYLNNLSLELQSSNFENVKKIIQDLIPEFEHDQFNLMQIKK